ncbi:hypothetical protein ABMX64_20000 [Vibrio vulnificus]|uniref:hypothetical protein n=1 Tax=Vibrio vulnificus TaxID=672 RepID=UPI0040590905
MKHHLDVGQLFIPTEGEFPPEFGVLGLFCVTTTFIIEDKFVEWADAIGRSIEQDGSVDIYPAKEPRFIEWLEMQGFIKRQPYLQFSVGNNYINSSLDFD